MRNHNRRLFGVRTSSVKRYQILAVAVAALVALGLVIVVLQPKATLRSPHGHNSDKNHAERSTPLHSEEAPSITLTPPPTQMSAEAVHASRQQVILDRIRAELRNSPFIQHHPGDAAHTITGNNNDNNNNNNMDATMERRRLSREFLNRLNAAGAGRATSGSTGFSGAAKNPLEDLIRRRNAEVGLHWSAPSQHSLKPSDATRLKDMMMSASGLSKVSTGHPLRNPDALHPQQTASPSSQQRLHTAVSAALHRRWGASSDSIPHFSLVLMTTLKPCSENEAIKYAQLDAITSWLAVPLQPHPPHVALLATLDAESLSGTCEAWIADRVRRTFGDDRLTILSPASDGFGVGPHGTVLLGSSIRAVQRRFPSADGYMFLNADIILEPVTASFCIEMLTSSFTEFFAVGRRTSLQLPLVSRASWVEDHGDASGAPDPNSIVFDFRFIDWASKMESKLSTAKRDRIDAEDFFLWTKGFFRNSKEVGQDPFLIPEFHIGRPAYDNWLVHHAIHTWKPVVDVSSVMSVYHQVHDYAHLLGKDRRDNASAAATYWGGEEQQANYDLGIRHGGWRHGLIDFCPMSFRDVKVCRDAAVGELIGTNGCRVELTSNWKPFEDDDDARNANLISRTDYERRYHQFRRRNPSG